MSENPQTNIGETSNGVQKLIADAKTICIIPSGIHEPESLTAALALFYTLKELQKNVNLKVQLFNPAAGLYFPTQELRYCNTEGSGRSIPGIL